MKKRGTGSWMLLMLLMSLLYSMSALAKTSTSTINSVRIIVGDSLRNLSADSELPSIGAQDFSEGDSEKYSIEDARWHDSNQSDYLEVGATPKVVLYLNAGYKEKSNGDEINYRFYGAYTSSNVKITNGTFVSAKRNSYDELEVVIRLKPAEGTYEVPEELHWREGALGQASWSAPENGSGYYDVVLYRDGKKVVKITTDSRRLNLYPWMTLEGDYSFSVTTIPYTADQKKYGKKSDTVESDIQTISSYNRSNGDGKYDANQVSGANSGNGSPTGNAAVVGWYQNNGKWYFRYPNGQGITSSWLSWKGLWYHFNSQGQMDTGWYQNAYGKWFYLDPTNGDMKIGWQQIGGVWYYFTTTNDDTQGTMFQNMFGHVDNNYYYFDGNGQMKTGWVSIKDSSGQQQYYYFYDNGRMARSTSIDGFKLDANGRWIH